MPLYIYRCNECDHEFQVRQRMVDDPLTECPVCSGAVRRIVSSVGVVFKGSGFYVTDNRSSVINGKHGKAKAKDGSSSSTETAAATPGSATSAAGSSSDSSASSG